MCRPEELYAELGHLVAKIKRTVGREPTVALGETLRQVVEYEKTEERESE